MIYNLLFQFYYSFRNPPKKVTFAVNFIYMEEPFKDVKIPKWKSVVRKQIVRESHQPNNLTPVEDLSNTKYR